MKTKKTAAHDVAIIGLGIMGSAAAFNLAARGFNVLAIEQFKPGHQNGSSHGHSRIIRSAYAEDSSYVPLAQRSFALWRELQRKTGARLLTMTGGLDIGPAHGRLINGTIAACRTHEIDHLILSGPYASSRFPALNLTKEFAVVQYDEAGILNPEACVDAFCNAAKDQGATLLKKTRITEIHSNNQSVTLRTQDGAEHMADQLVITAGAWVMKLVPDLSPFLHAERQVVGWFNPSHGDYFKPDRLPVFILEENRSKKSSEPAIDWYGFPAFNQDPPKFARYGHRHQRVNAASLDHRCNDDDRAVFQNLQPFFSADIGTPVEMQTCLFTKSSDGHFVMGFHPRHENIYIASPCSGHGFKFAPVIGEIIADMIGRGETSHDIKLHDINRLNLV